MPSQRSLPRNKAFPLVMLLTMVAGIFASAQQPRDYRDVPLDDLGIQQAMTKLYKLDATDKKGLREKMLKISQKWAPYRTYACLHLWQYKDTP